VFELEQMRGRFVETLSRAKVPVEALQVGRERPSMSTTAGSPKPSSARLAWLSADWIALFVALGLAALVRAGVIAGVTW
jgi:hypothetical protein